jgi:hypothetical protein
MSYSEKLEALVDKIHATVETLETELALHKVDAQKIDTPEGNNTASSRLGMALAEANKTLKGLGGECFTLGKEIYGARREKKAARKVSAPEVAPAAPPAN